MINVLADQYLYNLQSFLPDSVNLTFFDPEEGLPDPLGDTHALLVRTVLQINEETLPNLPSQLKFVGTASAGSDHVDIDYLKNNGITLSDAAGCNARSVAEYVATALLLWSEKQQFNLQEKTVGIVGVGNVGTEVEQLLSKLNIKTELYDPPKAERNARFTSASLEEVLSCNILTFHTPLTTSEKHPTYHWLDEVKLSNRQFKLVINSARGGVTDETALLQAMEKGNVENIIIDTWENEPELNLPTAEQAFIKTPHIAGYSVQAKDNASRLVVNAMLEHFDIPKPKNEEQQTPKILEEDISEFDSLYDLLTELHPIKKYESELQKIIAEHPKKREKLFNELRANYPLRQEFAQTFLPASYFERFPVLTSLGFSEITKLPNLV